MMLLGPYRGCARIALLPTRSSGPVQQGGCVVAESNDRGARSCRGELASICTPVVGSGFGRWRYGFRPSADRYVLSGAEQYPEPSQEELRKLAIPKRRFDRLSWWKDQPDPLAVPRILEEGSGMPPRPSSGTWLVHRRTRQEVVPVARQDPALLLLTGCVRGCGGPADTPCVASRSA